MKAMILAAGLGTRLQPLTLNRPKALLEVEGIPLLGLVLARLSRQGFNDIVVNAYHMADQIVSFLDEYQKRSTHARLTLAVSRETSLLDTGGGLQNAASFFDDEQPFLVHNVDVLTDLDLNRLVEAHRSSKVLATLAVRKRETTRYFLFDEEDRLCGWQSLESNETRMARTANGTPTPLGFMGIQVLSPKIFEKLTAVPPFSLVEAYLQLASAAESIAAFRADDSRWIDLGRKEHLEQASTLFGKEFFEDLKTPST
jgi:NDP-sugar pyrophosphorylase family protein